MGNESANNSTLEWVPDAVLIIADDGQILLANAAAERLFGYSRQELIGQPVKVCLPEISFENHPYILDPSGEVAPRPPIEVLELDARHKDGLPFPVEISVMSFGAGREVRGTVTVRDIRRRTSWRRFGRNHRRHSRGNEHCTASPSREAHHQNRRQPEAAEADLWATAAVSGDCQAGPNTGHCCH